MRKKTFQQVLIKTTENGKNDTLRLLIYDSKNAANVGVK